MSEWINNYGNRPTGCLPRVTKPGDVCGLAGERLDEVIPWQEWDAKLDEIGGEVDFSDCVGEIYDQNGYGSCAWESTTKAGEVACRLAGMDTPLLNAWFGYGIAVNWRGGPRIGTNIDSNLVQAMRTGLGPASLWPRSQGPNRKPTPDVYEEALRYRPIEAWDCVNINEVGTCLQKRVPVVIGWKGHSELLVGLKKGKIVKVCGSYGNAYYGGSGYHDERVDQINFDYGAFAIRAMVDRAME